ncbi:MAG TPA: GAF domain-containing protein [Solirubrobacteraceae bacterium]
MPSFEAPRRAAREREREAKSSALRAGRDELQGLAEEQVALRRVATLVARAAPQEQVFAAVAEEVGRVLPVEFAILSRYEADGSLTILAGSGTSVANFPAGSRWSLGGKNVSTLVFETSLPVRIDDYPNRSSGPIGVSGREQGVRSAVATPITVEGQLWGVMTVGSTVEELPLPADIEARLGQFTELLATALANTESRTALARLAEEQAALRRVATLVAAGASPQDVFASVVEEVGQLLPVDLANMFRYGADRTQTFVATWGRTGVRFPPGERWPLGGKNVATIVFETRRPTRIEDYSDASGPVSLVARETDLRSAVGAPIIVEGHLWGAIAVGSRGDQPLPPDTEARLASFTELVVTAIANTESRAELARLGEEQAALRRVATLVARGTPQEELFAAVVDEVGELLPIESASMSRYDPDDLLTFVATWGQEVEPFAVGSRQRIGGKNLGTIVFETGRPARLDRYADTASGPLGAGVTKAGIRSSVATPITVEGRLWGVIAAGSVLERPLPPDTEARLGSFTELVATAIANAESRAALAGSRARIVAASDASRRRIERDLHDGAQQRLVHAVIVLKLALRALSGGEANAKALVAEALQHAEQANFELRELAHGILPAALTRGGLQAGVEALVSRVSLPVIVDVSVGRLSAGVEATAYFVVSEALTNVVKHARADGAGVTARLEGGDLRVEVRDDGIGGARSDQTTGLGGLEDRVSALGGRLVLESPHGVGTRVRALLPLSGSD